MTFGSKVTRKDGERLSWGRALARAFGYFFSAIPLFLGFLWSGLNRRKRAWHDFIAGTVVIREREP